MWTHSDSTIYTETFSYCQISLITFYAFVFVFLFSSVLFIHIFRIVGGHNISFGGTLNASQIFLTIEALALILQILFKIEMSDYQSTDFKIRHMKLKTFCSYLISLANVWV